MSATSMTLADGILFCVGAVCFWLGYGLARDKYKRLLDRSWERERHLHQTMNDWLRSQKAWRQIEDDRDNGDWWKRG